MPDRVERVVAAERESVAVKCVAARARHGIHGCAGIHAVARRTHAALDLELLERVGERHRLPDVVQRIVVVAAVDQIQRAVAGAAGDGDRHRARILALASDERARCAVVDGRSRQHHELRGLPAVERQADHLLLRHRRADARVARLHHRRICGHRDGFLHGADLHRHVDDRARPDGERETGSLVGVEALQLGFELVRTDGQIPKHVLAALVGHDEAGDARGGLGHLDLDAGKRAA